jgi:hypothetical protein
LKRSVEGKNEMMITKDSIIRRNADGSFLHHGAPIPLTRDAVPVGSEVGGIGEKSFGYREYNQTNRPVPQGKIGNTDPQREDGAYRHVLARWKTGAEVEIVEDGDSAFLLLWEPPRPGEGRPQSAITAEDAHRQMFDRVRDHDSKKPPAARRALAAIKRGADSLESIAAANRDFWGKK